MPNPKQSNIGISKDERGLLNLAKEYYEASQGACDWGYFLTDLCIGYLLQIGVAQQAERDVSQEYLWYTTCPECGENIRTMVTGKMPQALRTACPECDFDLILVFETGEGA